MRHKITRSVKYNWWIKRLDTQYNELTNQNLKEVPKVVQPTKKNFGDFFNKQPNIPSQKTPSP